MIYSFDGEQIELDQCNEDIQIIFPNLGPTYSRLLDEPSDLDAVNGDLICRERDHDS